MENEIQSEALITQEEYKKELTSKLLRTVLIQASLGSVNIETAELYTFNLTESRILLIDYANHILNDKD